MEKEQVIYPDFEKSKLVPTIIQDSKTNEVLMLGYMSKESYEKTLYFGQVHFYSRKKKQIWKKGEKSNNIQKVKKILFDCDNDTLLILVEQVGGACHKGYRSCFYQELNNSHDKLMNVGEVVFNPDEVYK